MNKNITITLYQAKLNCKHIFMPYQLMKKNGDPDPADYEKVYQTKKTIPDKNSDKDTLEKFFIEMNRDSRPGAGKFRSLSVSDIVCISEKTRSECYYCDVIGFQPVTFDTTVF